MKEDVRNRIVQLTDELESISLGLEGDDKELMEEAIDKLRSAVESLPTD